MNLLRKLFVVLLLSMSFAAFAQDDGDPCVQSFGKQIDKTFAKARDFQKSGKKAEANALYNEILEEYPEHLEANYYLALSYYLPIKLNDFVIERKQDARKVIEAADRMYAVCPHYKIIVHLYAAHIAYLLEDFAEATKHAQVLIDNPDLVKNTEDLDFAENIVKYSKVYADILNNPVPFDPHPVSGISTDKDEYLATLSPDAEYFYFTRRQPEHKSDYFGSEIIDKEYFSYSKKISADRYEQGKPLPYPFNQSNGEGSPTINLANDLLIFAMVHEVRVKQDRGAEQIYPNYDLYYSRWDGYEWSEPQSLGDRVNRPDSWESQPSLSSDGKVLFFASDRNGGYGGSDIWMSRQDANGNWETPVNLGPTINTKGNERSPFLHTDSKTLYFASAGHAGLGGMDIFYSKMGLDGKWGKPVNIGYPINSENDEVDFFVSLDGATAYFSSNNLNSKDWNIYSFELYEAARPKSMAIVKGTVTTDDKEQVESVVELLDEDANVIAVTKINENTGNFALATEVDKEKTQQLVLNIKQEGYAYDTKLVTIAPETEQKENVIQSDAEVKKIEVGKICDLHDIYFETNSYSLTAESKRIIDVFADFLRNNPTVKVELQGHTDNIGNDEDNRILSDNRAKSVYNHLISKGIPANRLRYKGYGESKPIATNATEEGRAKNRRTVFLIYEQ